MGQIVVADLQGKLTMDKRAFSEGIASARQDVAALHAELNDLATQIPQIGQNLGNLSIAHQQAAQMTQVARQMATQPLPPTTSVGPAPVNANPHLQAAQGAQPIPGYGPGAGQGVANIPGLSGSLGPSFQGFQGMNISQYGNLLAGAQTQAPQAPQPQAPYAATQGMAHSVQQMMQGPVQHVVHHIVRGPAEGSAPDPADTGLYPGITPVVRGTPGTPTYLRTQAAQSESLNLARDFLQPLSPALAELLPAFISPVLAAGIAAGTLGTALKSAADEATAYAAVQFRLSMAVRGTSLAPGGVNQDFLVQEQERLRGLGIGGVQASGLEETAARYAKTPGQISGIDTMTMNLARRFGIAPEQAQGMMTSMLSTGSTGQFTQYIPEIRDQESVAYAERMINQKTSGAAQTFMGTPAGGQAKLSADLEDVWTKFGTELLPVFEGITKAADDMMPALDTFLQFLGLVGTGLGDIGRIVGLPLDLLGKLVPGFDNLGKHMGDFFDLINDRSNRFLNFLDSQGNVTPMTRMTGYSYDAAGNLGVAHTTVAGVNVDPAQWSLEQSQAYLASKNLPAQGAVPRYGTVSGGIPQGMPGANIPLTPQQVAAGMTTQDPNAPFTTTLADGTVVHTTVGQWAAGLGTAQTSFPSQASIQQAYQKGALNPDGTTKMPGAPGSSSKPGIDDQLALDPNAIAKVAAMKSVQEEVTASVQAVKGVQDVFAELSTFHVDFSQVSGNLDNLEQGITYLQQWWIHVATDTGKDTVVYQSQLGQTKTWLDMTNSMVSMMTGAMGMLNSIYKGADLIPSQGQTQAVITRVVSMFDEVDAIAQGAFANKGSGTQYVDQQQFAAWLSNATALMSVMGAGSDVLAKILTTPLPEPGQIKETARRAVSVLTEVSSALNDAFVTNGQNSSMGLIIGGSGSKIDSGLLNAANMAAPGNTLLQFMSAGVGIFKSMVNFWVPSEGEIDQAVDRVMSITDKLALSIEKRMKAPQASQAALGSVMQSMGMPNIPGIMSAAGLGPSDQTYAAQAATATNMNAVLQPMLAGVQLLQGMRNLSVPSPGEIQAVVGGTFKALDDAIAYMPAPNANDLAKMKAWGDAAGPAMGALSSGADLLSKMRDLAEPSASEMSSFKSHMSSLQSFGSSMSMDADTAAKIQQGGAALGAVYSALSSGADVLGKVFSVPMPSTNALSGFKSSLDQANAMFEGEAASMPQATADHIKDWAAGMGPAYQALASGVDWLGKTRDIIMPSQHTIDEVLGAELYVAGRLKTMATNVAPEITSDMKRYGDALLSEFGGMNAGTDALGKMVTANLPTSGMVDDYFSSLDMVVVAYADHMAKWVSKMQLENAKYAPDMGKEFSALGQALDVFNKLGILRFDYTGPINMLFNNMDTVITVFAARSSTWKSSMSDETHRMALDVADEMDAVGKAIAPLVNMQQAARVGPGVIEAVMGNIGLSVKDMSKLASMPELRGGKSAELVSLGSTLDAIFTPLKAAVDTIDAMSKPTSATGGRNLINMIDDLFMKTAGPPPSTVASMRGGTGSGNTYNNCLIIDGVVAGQDPDVAALIQKITRKSAVVNGGQPVNGGGGGLK